MIMGGKMKKYTKHTDLEQASRDPSLAIITDRITTPEELSKLYAKYRILPKKQKRYSNYYSNEFQGRRVSEMYVLMKDKFKPGGELSEAWQMPKDAFVVSEPDLYYKEESFNKGDTNICFILGHSGSGKSRMASTLEGNAIDHIELDDLLLTRDHFTMDGLKAYSDMIYSFFSGKGAKYYIGADQRDSIPKEEYEDRVFVDFVEFAMEYAGQHREKKFILDGIWIYLYFDDPSVFEDYAVFIKGTSFLKSKMRAMNRERHRDKETLQDRKKMFGREARNYLLDEEKINSYRSFFGGKPETIFRSETNETDPETEAVIKELNTIDRGFVNNDPDVIRETLKRAEANTDLSEWNKVMIINECTAALFELKA